MHLVLAFLNRGGTQSSGALWRPSYVFWGQQFPGGGGGWQVGGGGGQVGGGGGQVGGFGVQPSPSSSTCCISKL